MQYVPITCKITQYGKEVNIVGPKKHLYCCTYPMEQSNYACNVMSLCYTIPTIPVPGFLNLTLCPSNQIIHPGRIYTIFKDWDGKSSFAPDELPELYKEMD